MNLHEYLPEKIFRCATVAWMPRIIAEPIEPILRPQVLSDQVRFPAKSLRLTECRAVEARVSSARSGVAGRKDSQNHRADKAKTCSYVLLVCNKNVRMFERARVRSLKKAAASARSQVKVAGLLARCEYFFSASFQWREMSGTNAAAAVPSFQDQRVNRDNMRRGLRILSASLLISLLPLAMAVADPRQGMDTSSDTSSSAVKPSKEQLAMQAGAQAVVYGLPLVLMDITQRKTTNVVPGHLLARPVNQFAHLRAFPTASFKDVVRANVDTLYSSAFLDLAREPLVLSVPDTHGRYYLLPMLDAWTNVFASPGTRTTGNGAAVFAITGPDWKGTLPSGMHELKSPTNMAWILGRTQTNGPADYAAVHAIQDGYTLVPLSQFGKPYTPPAGKFDPTVDMKTPPVEQLQKMSATQFFSALARLLKANPPPAAEAGILAQLAKIGVRPGEDFDPNKLDPAVAKGLDGSVGLALGKLQEAQKHMGAPVNGWHIPPQNLGNFGTDYGTRAIVALIAFGANLPADAVYPTTFVDASGKALNGANHYTLHFAKGQTPPVNAFWSVTMYDAQSFFVDNPLNRYALSSWMPLAHNSDGSIDLYVQHDSPGKDKEANWLPAPAANFNVTLRMYWPKGVPPSITDGSWLPPALTLAP
jgi:hypothetical protein